MNRDDSSSRETTSTIAGAALIGGDNSIGSSKQEKNKKTRIVLYTFPPVPSSYSMSPFGLKAESFLRVNNLPYDICYTSAFSKEGLIPYMRLFPTSHNCNDGDVVGEEVPDSNAIIARLLDDPTFSTPSQDGLTKQQEAVTHAFVRMLEEHTAQIGFLYRYGLHMPEFCAVTQLRERLFMGDESGLGAFIFKLWSKGQPKGTLQKSKLRNLLRRPTDLWSTSFEDLRALEDLLEGGGPSSSTGDDECACFFFGRPEASVLDCAVFGHLSQFLFIQMDFPQKRYLIENCPKLLRFMKHFKTTYWPDWETKCQKQPNDKLRGDNPILKKKLRKLKFTLSGMVAVSVAAVGLVIHRWRTN